jgi:hypothetical protein
MTPRALTRIAAVLAEEPIDQAKDPFALVLRAVVRAAERANRLEPRDDGPPTVRTPEAIVIPLTRRR